jgi:hypothetical protein
MSALPPKADMVQHDRKQTFFNAVVARAFVFSSLSRGGQACPQKGVPSALALPALGLIRR